MEGSYTLKGINKIINIYVLMTENILKGPITSKKHNTRGLIFNVIIQHIVTMSKYGHSAPNLHRVYSTYIPRST